MDYQQERTLRQSVISGTVILAVFFLLSFAVRPAVTYFIPAKASYLRWGIVSIVEVAGCIAAVMVLYRAGLLQALRELRLAAPFLRALAFGFAVTSPMIVIFALSGPVKANVDLLNLTFSSGVAPITEEILFRGFAFWMLYRYAGWSFWLASLFPAVIFGYAHLYQSPDLLEATGIFAITAVGSVWFSWLLLRWDSLWVPIVIHALMNLWWDIFAVDETALGGGVANVSRLSVIASSIIVTIYRAGRDQAATSRAD